MLITSITGHAHVRTVFRRAHPRLIFRSTTCGRMRLVSSFISRTVRAGVSKAIGVTSLTMGCEISHVIVVSTTGTHRPRGTVRCDGHITRVCIRSSSYELGHSGKRASVFVMHLNRICPAGARYLVAVSRTYVLALRIKIVKSKKRICVIKKPKSKLLSSMVDRGVGHRGPSISSCRRIQRRILTLIRCDCARGGTVLVKLVGGVIPVFPLSSAR